MRSLFGLEIQDGTFARFREQGLDVRTVGETPPDFALRSSSGLPLPPAWQPRHLVQSIPPEIMIVDDCYVFPNGAVLIGNHYLYREILFVHVKAKHTVLHVSPDTNFDPISRSVSIKADYPIRKLDGTFFVATNFRQGNFYHYVHEILGRSYFLERAEQEVGEELAVILSYRKKQLLLQRLLSEAVFGARQIIYQRRHILHLKRAVIARNPVSPKGVCIPAMMHLRHKLKNAVASTGKSGKPLYISRKDRRSTSFHREIANEAALEERLSRYGFETMVVSEVPPELQIEAFSGARVMVGMHGAGLTNMLFMADESAVLELSGFPLTADFFARDAHLWGFDYFVAQSQKNGPGVDVDLEAVDRYLRYLSDRKLLRGRAWARAFRWRRSA